MKSRTWPNPSLGGDLAPSASLVTFPASPAAHLAQLGPPAFCSWNMPCMFWPQGICTCYFVCPQSSSQISLVLSASHSLGLSSNATSFQEPSSLTLIRTVQDPRSLLFPVTFHHSFVDYHFFANLSLSLCLFSYLLISPTPHLRIWASREQGLYPSHPDWYREWALTHDTNSNICWVNQWSASELARASPNRSTSIKCWDSSTIPVLCLLMGSHLVREKAPVWGILVSTLWQVNVIVLKFHIPLGRLSLFSFLKQVYKPLPGDLENEWITWNRE